MIAQPLVNRQKVVIVVTEHGTARQQRDFRHLLQFSHGVFDPLACLAVIDPGLAGEREAAELGLLVSDNHACAGAPGGQRRA